MFTRRILGTLASLSLLFFSGCKIDTPPLTITVTGTDQTTGSTTSQLSCAVSLSASVTQVVSGDQVPVTIQVTGGSSPYTYAQLAEEFLNQITISDSFVNNSISSASISHTYTISDNTGSTASCSLTVIVNPVYQPSPLACSFSADNTNPAVGQLVNYTVTVSGGTPAYTSSNYMPGSNTTYASTLTQSSATTFSSSAIYGASGLKTVSVLINDSLGNQTSCSQIINVAASPSVSVTALPSTTVASGTPISLTATTANFNSAPEITFSTVSGGILFTAVGSTIVVSTTDYLAHTVVIDVVASTATQQASTSITLNFTSSQTLSCNLSHASGYYRAGDYVTFSVSSTTGEALSLTSLSAQDGTVVDALGGSSARIQFSSSGYKNVYATAQAVYSNGATVPCNSGATLTDTVYIYSAATALSCTAITSPNPSYRGNYFLARAQVPSGAGVGTVRLTKIQTSSDAITSYSYYNDATSSYFAIYNGGTFRIVLTVTDGAGNTATCSTYQTVY